VVHLQVIHKAGDDCETPEATSMTVESNENVSETSDTAEDSKIVNNETDSVKIAVVYFSAQEIQDYCRDNR
jgi:hypothetical protein